MTGRTTQSASGQLSTCSSATRGPGAPERGRARLPPMPDPVPSAPVRAHPLVQPARRPGQSPYPEAMDRPPQAPGAVGGPSGPGPAEPTPLSLAIGGTRGLLDSSLPAVLFVLVYSRFGLRPGVTAALVLAAVLLVVRLLRKESPRYAANGFLGVAISAFVALRLGRAEGYFLPGIIFSALYGLVFAGSLLVRRPLVGVVTAALEGAGGPVSARLQRVYWWSTLGWAAVFGSRAVVQGALYALGRPGWLAGARLAMGWPLTLLALGLTAAAVRRARAHHGPAPAPAAPGPGPALGS